MAGMPLFAHVGRQKKNAAPDLQSSFPFKTPRFGVSKTQNRCFLRSSAAFVRILQSNHPHFPIKSEFLNQVFHVGRPA